MASDLFGKKIAVIPHRVDDEVSDLRQDVESAFAAGEGALDTGHVAAAELIMSAQPADTNTLTIGADVYEFDSNSTFTAGRLPVVIGADAQATLDALVAKINASGTEKVKAGKKGTTRLRIERADKAGGTPLRGPGASVALSETIADTADVWNAGNLNELGGGLRQKKAHGKLTVTALNIATAVKFDLPFTPVGVAWVATTSTGAPIQGTVTTATVAASGAELTISPGAGLTDLTAGDIIHWWAWDAGVDADVAADA